MKNDIILNFLQPFLQSGFKFVKKHPIFTIYMGICTYILFFHSIPIGLVLMFSPKITANLVDEPLLGYHCSNLGFAVMVVLFTIIFGLLFGLIGTIIESFIFNNGATPKLEWVTTSFLQLF